MEKEIQNKRLLNFIKLSPEAKIPQKATAGAAGMDLCACLEQDITINPGERSKIPCGIAAEIPEGYGAFVFARSGLAIKHGITLSNGVGVIDSDYRGEICVGLSNIGSEKYTIQHGDRVAQLVILKVENVAINEVEKISETTRGTGGFGSTGK